VVIVEVFDSYGNGIVLGAGPTLPRFFNKALKPKSLAYGFIFLPGEVKSAVSSKNPRCFSQGLFLKGGKTLNFFGSRSWKVKDAAFQLGQTSEHRAFFNFLACGASLRIKVQITMGAMERECKTQKVFLTIKTFLTLGAVYIDHVRFPRSFG
jgi:hypothetical protein